MAIFEPMAKDQTVIEVLSKIISTVALVLAA